MGHKNLTRQAMTSELRDPSDKDSSLPVLAYLSVLVGGVAGIVVALFRLALVQADHWRDVLIARAHSAPVIGFLTTVGLVAGVTAVAAWLVRRFSPEATGSGIPHVEAVVSGARQPASWRLLPVKFTGGVLALGSGLALGREGPSVQMGATLGHLLSRLFRRAQADCRVLMAAGAGAGLATAFNAPIAGAVFVLEELVRRFDTRIAISALGASASAIAVARLLTGSNPDFHVEPTAAPAIGSGVLFTALGIVAGLAGLAYNRAILGALAVTDQFKRWPVELRAGLIGAAVGVLAWFAPGWVGGGGTLTQQALNGGQGVGLLLFVFAARFVLGAGSYAAGTPGGLFAPMLTLGAQLGLLFATLCGGLGIQHLGAPLATFAVVGMAAFFTAVVRAPLTGIVLIVELTAGYTHLLPLLWACFAAMVVPTLLRNMPIYDSLRDRMAPVPAEATKHGPSTRTSHQQ